LLFTYLPKLIPQFKRNKKKKFKKLWNSQISSLHSSEHIKEKKNSSQHLPLSWKQEKEQIKKFKDNQTNQEI
jgi:hypothetical protein